jgi:hypothetical protein
MKALVARTLIMGISWHFFPPGPPFLDLADSCRGKMRITTAYIYRVVGKCAFVTYSNCVHAAFCWRVRVIAMPSIWTSMTDAPTPPFPPASLHSHPNGGCGAPSKNIKALQHFAQPRIDPQRRPCDRNLAYSTFRHLSSTTATFFSLACFAKAGGKTILAEAKY